MDIKVLGPGCPKCQQTEKIVKELLSKKEHIKKTQTPIFFLCQWNIFYYKTVSMIMMTFPMPFKPGTLISYSLTQANAKQTCCSLAPPKAF